MEKAGKEVSGPGTGVGYHRAASHMCRPAARVILADGTGTARVGTRGGNRQKMGFRTAETCLASAEGKISRNCLDFTFQTLGIETCTERLI